MNAMKKPGAKKQLLLDFVEKYKTLPAQGSKEWLDGRTNSIGGSEMGTISGKNPYKKLRELVSGHIGLSHFSGNINTYWGTILEDLVTVILEKKWGQKIYETGSLPGAIPGQKYSPDGLVYLPFMDQIVLIEIKDAARRSPTGRVPGMYKPQVFTGLDSIKIADVAIFVDAMFRRCPVADFKFNTVFDTLLHPKKKVDTPLLLSFVGIYEPTYSGEYDALKEEHGAGKEEWFDVGGCCIETLEAVTKPAAQKELGIFFPKYVEDSGDEKTNEKNIGAMFDEFSKYCEDNGYAKIAVMPIKLFRMDFVPIDRTEWTKVYNRSTRVWEQPAPEDMPMDVLGNPYESFVKSNEETINKVLHDIKYLNGLDEEEKLKQFEELYPSPNKSYSDALCDELVNSLMV
jgi:hypothetical protein